MGTYHYVLFFLLMIIGLLQKNIQAMQKYSAEEYEVAQVLLMLGGYSENNQALLPDEHQGYACHWDECTESYTDENSFYQHVFDVHISAMSRKHEGIFVCEWSIQGDQGCGYKCKYSSSKRDLLQIHLRRHTGERPFKCDYDGCGEFFRQKNLLNIHRRTHSDGRPFPCPYCSQRCKNKPDVGKHIKSMHKRRR